jgi:putative membrane protein
MSDKSKTTSILREIVFPVVITILGGSTIPWWWPPSAFVVFGIVTTLVCIILTQMPTGIEVDDFSKAEFTSLVFGSLNSLMSWFLNDKGINVFTNFLFFLIGNTILFCLAAILVKGYRLRWGITSSLIGGLCVALTNSVLF